MTLRHMNVFINVCRTGSMTAAAKELYTSQPAVSAVISELEQNYGVKLFDRISKQLYLTDAGKTMLNYAKHITHTFDEMDRVLRDTDALGMLRIGTTPHVDALFPQKLLLLKEKYPGLKISLVVSSTKQVVDAVFRSDLDLALVEGNPVDPYLVTAPCRSDRLVFVCSNDHPFAGRDDVELADAIREPMVLLAKGMAIRDCFDSVLAVRGLSVDPVWSCDSTHSCLCGVQHGFGISVLSLRYISDWLEQNRVRTFTVKGLEMASKITIVYHKNKYLTQSARDFIELWKEQ